MPCFRNAPAEQAAHARLELRCGLDIVGRHGALVEQDLANASIVHERLSSGLPQH